MSEIEFQNRRFDPDLTPFHELAKSMAKAFGYTADLEVDVCQGRSKSHPLSPVE